MRPRSKSESSVRKTFEAFVPSAVLISVGVVNAQNLKMDPKEGEYHEVNEDQSNKVVKAKKKKKKSIKKTNSVNGRPSKAKYAKTRDASRDADDDAKTAREDPRSLTSSMSSAEAYVPHNMPPPFVPYARIRA